MAKSQSAKSHTIIELTQQNGKAHWNNGAYVENEKDFWINFGQIPWLFYTKYVACILNTTHIYTFHTFILLLNHQLTGYLMHNNYYNTILTSIDKHNGISIDCY